MLSTHSVPFKEVFGTEIYYCDVNPLWTITEFIENVRPILSQAFRINQYDLEIVVPKYDETLREIPIEMGQSLTESYIILSNTWGQKLEYMSCYVRRKNFRYRQIDEFTIRRQQEQEMRECPICYDTRYMLVSRYVCRHTICSHCHEDCCNSGHMTCPLCRADSNNVYNMV